MTPDDMKVLRAMVAAMRRTYSIDEVIAAVREIWADYDRRHPFKSDLD